MNKLFTRILLFSLPVSLAVAAMGQIKPAPTLAPLPKTEYKPMKPMPTPAPVPQFGYKWSFNEQHGDDSEKSISADSRVSLTLCVNEASLKVNGWNRNEVRVFVRGGSTFMFKVQEKGSSGLPALLSVYGYNAKGRMPAYTDCLSAEEIEIDLPVGAAINVKGREARTVIDTVRKASVNTIGGDIVLRNVSDNVWASTGQGDITVEESQGPMTLNTTTGNVVVFDVGPRDIGDVFKAKTLGGNLSVQDIKFRQVEVNSISGSIVFAGEIPNGAGYSVGSNNGSIRLQIPEKSNFQLSAIFPSGQMTYDVPFKILTENVSEDSMKTIQAKFGSGGESLVKLTTNLGTIVIKKQ